MPRAKKRPSHYNSPIDHTKVPPIENPDDHSIFLASMKYTRHKNKMKAINEERKFFFHSGLVTQLLNTKNFHKLTDNIFNPTSYATTLVERHSDHTKNADNADNTGPIEPYYTIMLRFDSPLTHTLAYQFDKEFLLETYKLIQKRSHNK